MRLDSQGLLFGITNAMSDVTNYRVTASNSRGSRTTASDLTIRVRSFAGFFPLTKFPVSTTVSSSPLPNISTAAASTFAVTGGSFPPGISINPTTGTISGTTSAAPGNFSATISVTNSYGTSSMSYSVRVRNVADLTCNTVGISPGCSASAPFSCTEETSTCYAQYSTCVKSGDYKASCQF